ncbi:protein EVI2A isoform X2 [Echinops telfairi]|nr:protein EVI2A isoform X2 [Echinops telfairi]
MELTEQCLHLAFLLTFLPLAVETKANHTHLWLNHTVGDPAIQNKAGENTTTNPPAPDGGDQGNSTSQPERATTSPITSSTPKSEQELYTPVVVRKSSAAVQNIENTSKSHSGIFKEDACDENNHKMAMLICFIIIAVLFLICTLLFLSTVILANKVSTLRRAKQTGKRQPRSNGDFLASSGLWPADSDTWKRAEQLTGPNLMMQSTGGLTATRERKDGGGTEKHSLANRCLNEENHQGSARKILE